MIENLSAVGYIDVGVVFLTLATSAELVVAQLPSSVIRTRAAIFLLSCPSRVDFCLHACCLTVTRGFLCSGQEEGRLLPDVFSLLYQKAKAFPEVPNNFRGLRGQNHVSDHP